MWLYSISGKNFLLITLLLLGSCAVPAVKGDEMQKSSREQIKISDMTLSFTTPSIKLSKDFGAPILIKEIDLNDVTKPNMLFHGYWDGPRYQLISVTGTLRIWLELSPWPSELNTVNSCDAKTSAYVNKEFQAEMSKYKQGKRNHEPKIDISKLTIAGRNSLRYKLLSDPNPSINYVIPLNNEFLLYLMFISIENSMKSAGWQELSEREQENFLQSLSLTEDDGGCN